MNKKLTAVLLLVLGAGCVSTPQEGANPPAMDPSRKVSEQDCTKAIEIDGGNLKCREVSDAEIRARIAEAEREAKARAERARAEQLAREEAARKKLADEEARRAAERRRLEEEAAAAAAAAAAAERERRERAEAEARAKAQAEQEAREAAARECRRQEQERSDGRAMLQNFVATYGNVGEFKGIAGQISAFLAKPSTAKPCPPG